MKYKLLFLFAFVVLVSMIQLHSMAQPAEAAQLTAYDVKLAYIGNWGIPHYGAFYSGSNGWGQFYTGPSGQPSGYSSWNWWGSGANVLLLEKRWLFSNWGEGFTASYHHAQLSCPC